jgi:hypothetical protein
VTQFTDEAWEYFRDKMHMTDADRPRIEAEMREDHNRYMQEADYDHLLAAGFLAIDTAREMAAYLHIPEEVLLEKIMKTAPNPQKMRDSILRARVYRANISNKD